MTYRYALHRCAHQNHECPLAPRRIVWVMLNPSTADDTRDDPTIRKCRGFTERLGYDEFYVVNLFALRATKPATLWQSHAAGTDICGPENDSEFRRVAARDVATQLIVCAWGAGKLLKVMLERINAVEALLAGHPLHCLGFTKGDNPRTNFAQPRHPLMLPYASQLQPYPAAPTQHEPRSTR